MKTFVISLSRSNDRRQHIQNQLDKLGIKFEIIEAVDGSKLAASTIHDFKAIRKTAYPDGIKQSWDVPEGVIGCSLSHLKVYQEIVNRKIELSVVLEDDATPTKELLAIYSQPILNTIKNIQQLDVLQMAAVKKQFSYMPQLKYRGRLKAGGGITIGKSATAVPGTSCYLITLKGAKKLLEASHPLRYSSDQLIANCEYFGVNLWLTKSPLCFQNRQLLSTIEKRQHKTTAGKLAKMLWEQAWQRISIKQQLSKLGWRPYFDESILQMEARLKSRA